MTKKTCITNRVITSVTLSMSMSEWKCLQFIVSCSIPSMSVLRGSVLAASRPMPMWHCAICHGWSGHRDTVEFFQQNFCSALCALMPANHWWHMLFGQVKFLFLRSSIMHPWQVTLLPMLVFNEVCNDTISTSQNGVKALVVTWRANPTLSQFL